LRRACAVLAPCLRCACAVLAPCLRRACAVLALCLRCVSCLIVAEMNRAVQSATQMLVVAAKALMSLVDEPAVIDYSKLSVTQFKVKEMEQQTKILKLEKEIQRAQKALFDMRKAHYARNPEASMGSSNKEESRILKHMQ
jgi:hypothetical protein